MEDVEVNEHELDRAIELDDWDPPDQEGEVADTVDAAFVDAVEAKITALRELYVESHRDEVLAEQFERLLREKDSRVRIRRWSGIVVKAPSGAGKSRMISRFLAQHPRVRDFDSGSSDFVHIDVPSPVTNKTLGLAVLRTMYPQRRGIAPTGGIELSDDIEAEVGDAPEGGLADIWVQVRALAVECKVWGLWIDEAHDLGNGGPKTLDVLQTTFKRWLAHKHRPILILSGTPEVESLFRTRELKRRLLPVDTPSLSPTTDTPYLRQMIAKYLREVGLGIDPSLREFVPRLVHAGTYQLGWTLNVVIEAIRVALLERADKLAIEHFARSYGAIVQCADQDNPFIADDWSGIDTVMQRGRQPDEIEKKPRRRRKRDETPW